MKKSILVVSVGTSCAAAEESCIRPVERAIQRAFPEYELRRAFTSRKIVAKLRRQGIFAEDETEALERLRREGFEEMRIVPTHILHGMEYERVQQAAGDMPVSEALLETEQDLEWMAALLEKIAAEEGRPLLAMGHGTEHAADAVYGRLRTKLSGQVRLACAAGAHSLEALLPELEAVSEKKLTLMPLMLVAGEHARNAMAGDGPDSWKSMLEARGFDLRIRMQGLGALEEVQRRFVEKAKKLL